MPFFPMPANEAERIESLYSYNILDTIEEKDFDELTELASVICQTPVALISLVDKDRQWFKSHHGVAITETSKELSFCAHAIASFDDIMIVNDTSKDERFAQNDLVTGDTNLVFYAGVPLINEDGYALGTLCVIDNEVKTLTDQQTSALKILAKQVMDKLELRRKVLVMEHLNTELSNSNIFIQKFASMAAHDIKNPLSSILLTSQALKIRLQKNEDEPSIRLIDLNITSIKNLATMVNEMLDYSKKPSLLLSRKREFDVADRLRKIMTMLNIPASCEIELPSNGLYVNMSEIAFEQIFLNLMSNAIRYNDKPGGNIIIRFSEDTEYYQFEVEDNGIGIAAEHHEKIFFNNYTLKITDRYKNMGTGIGLSTVKEIINVLNGVIYLKSETGLGTTFYIRLRK